MGVPAPTPDQECACLPKQAFRQDRLMTVLCCLFEADTCGKPPSRTRHIYAQRCEWDDTFCDCEKTCHVVALGGQHMDNKVEKCVDYCGCDGEGDEGDEDDYDEEHGDDDDR